MGGMAGDGQKEIIGLYLYSLQFGYTESIYLVCLDFFFLQCILLCCVLL